MTRVMPVEREARWTVYPQCPWVTSRLLPRDSNFWIFPSVLFRLNGLWWQRKAFRSISEACHWKLSCRGLNGECPRNTICYTNNPGWKNWERIRLISKGNWCHCPLPLVKYLYIDFSLNKSIFTCNGHFSYKSAVYTS